MIYVIERALYYYFLMREIGDAGLDFWKFVAGFFGVKPKEIKAYEKVLSNDVLAELSTLGDVEMYKNFLSGFYCAEDEFGKSKTEREAIEAKALALHKASALFGDDYVKVNRLRVLSHVYENDHYASVLYALQVLYLHNTDECEKFAEGILLQELKEGSNSDAGIILLKLRKEKAKETMTYLSGTPDMLLRPAVLKELKRRYGGNNGNIFRNKRAIGF